MFTRSSSEGNAAVAEMPRTDDPRTCTDPIKVLQVDFKPARAQEKLAPWIASGWTLQSTSPVLLAGQTAYIMAFLSRPQA